MSLHPEPAHTSGEERCDFNSTKANTNEETKTRKKEVHFPKQEVSHKIEPPENIGEKIQETPRQSISDLAQKLKDGTMNLTNMADDCMEPAIIDMRALMENLDASDDDMVVRKPNGRKAGGKGLKGSLRNHFAEEERRKKAAHMQEVKKGVRNGPKNQTKPKSKSKSTLKVEEGGNEAKDNLNEGDGQDGKEGQENGQEAQENGQAGKGGQNGKNGEGGPTGPTGPTGKNTKKSKAFIPFNPQDTLLLVGEGDFSFAVSVLQNGYIQPQNLVATSYDTETQVLLKYSTAGENLKFLKKLGVKILHEIDATKLSSSLKVHKVKLLPTRLNRIMFNFPHTGRGMKDANRNIRDHQNLVLGYFQSAKNLLQTFNGKMADTTGYLDGEFSESILLTVFEGEPYISWGIKALARNVGYKVERSGVLEWEAYSGYSHRRTDGMGRTTKRASDRSARTYVFTKYVPQEETKTKAVHSDSD